MLQFVLARAVASFLWDTYMLTITDQRIARFVPDYVQRFDAWLLNDLRIRGISPFPVSQGRKVLVRF